MAQKIDRDRLEKAILLVRGGYSAAEAARDTGLSVPTLRVYLTRDDLVESKLNAKGQIKHFPTMTEAEKFPGAEEILREIKPKYEYAGGEYIIIVP